jgi:hypothetical protein
VRAAAELALRNWPDLSSRELFRLRVAAAIAARHERNAGEMVLIVDEKLERQFAHAKRLEVLADVVQSSVDTGQPSATEAEALARKYLDESEAHVSAEWFMLLGALGCLLAVTRRPKEAIECEARAALGLQSLGRYDEISRSLSEWLRLSGVLGDREQFARADKTYQKAAPLGQLGHADRAFIELARCRAGWLLATGAPTTEWERTLEQLAADAGIPEHVSWSAIRWLTRMRAERSAATDELVEMLRTAAKVPASDALPSLCLLELDDALRAADSDGVTRAISRHSQIKTEWGLLQSLTGAAEAMGVDVPGYIARHYPY